MGPDTLLVGLSLVSFFSLVLVWVAQPAQVPTSREIAQRAPEAA